MHRRWSPLRLAVVFAAMPLSVSWSQTSGLGSVEFPNSGARRAQPAFLRGLALLHSFEYEDAAEAFREAQRVDSGFALAYWGEALTYDHPLWGEQDSTAARAALARLGAGAEERIARGRTPRERGYLTAVEALYGKGGMRERHQAYERTMARLHEEHPADLEAAALHALAILTVRDRHSTDLRPSVRAAAMVEEVRRRNPNHPGATHYLIHAYDDPVLAPLGGEVARRYARIAPHAEHALHMPSHIFVQLGAWEDMVASNEAAWTASKAWVKRKGRPNTDLDLHAASWLHYGYLQQGRHALARTLSDSLHALFAGMPEADVPEYVSGYLDDVDLQNVVETRRWDPEPPAEAPHGRNRIFRAAASAVRRGDRATVATALASYRARTDTLKQHHGMVPPPAKAFERVVTAYDARVNGRNEEAVAALKEAAELQEQMPIYGPPGVPPARELLGDLLLDLGRHADAAAAYDAALLRTPLRSAALLGRARAAAGSGDTEGARQWYGLLLRNWKAGDKDVPELEEARTGSRVEGLGSRAGSRL